MSGASGEVRAAQHGMAEVLDRLAQAKVQAPEWRQEALGAAVAQARQLRGDLRTLAAVLAGDEEPTRL